MANKNDLWGNIEIASVETTDTLSLIQEQADLLALKTNGKVKACFDSIKHKVITPPSSSSIAALTSELSQLIGPKKTVIEEVDEHKQLIDAQSLYQHKKYKFVVFSDKYKYRLFSLDYDSVYPLTFEIEYGILEDKVVKKEVDSFDESRDLLTRILTSKKVIFIIQRMISLSE